MSEFNKNLWAGWRSEYITSLSDGDKSCFLCDYGADPEHDAQNLVICRTPCCLMVMNRYPYTNGHLMVAPLRHLPSMDAFNDDELLDLNRLARDSMKMLSAAVSAHGFNMGMNFERCAGAGLPGHLHAHVVPRWSGDTNFMFTIGDTRVIPQSLQEVYGRLVQQAKGLGLA